MHSGSSLKKARIRRGWWAAIAVVPLLSLSVLPQHAGALGTSPWRQYLFGQTHTSYNGSDTAITAANATSLQLLWHFNPPAQTMPGQPGKDFFAGPVVVDGKVFIGANTGVLYALDEATGQVQWEHFLGYQPSLNCAGYGVVSTATVATDPATSKLTVYVGAGDGYLYALDAATGEQVWASQVVRVSSTKNAGMVFSSPTVSRGHVYIGMSSNCDFPLIRGGLRMFDQKTGHLLLTHYTVKKGSKGGSIWSSAALTSDGRTVFVSTGNAEGNQNLEGETESIVRLDAKTLATQDMWQVPLAERTFDDDFGGSPTLFSIPTPEGDKAMVGACNKNGFYYAWDAGNLAAGPVWKFKIGEVGHGAGRCLGAAAFDGQRLYIGGPATTVDSQPVSGSVAALDPATGNVLWQLGLAASVQSSVSLAGGGVVAVPIWDQSTTSGLSVKLVDAATGTLVTTLFGNSEVFGQPAFSDGLLFLASYNKGINAYHLP